MSGWTHLLRSVLGPDIWPDKSVRELMGNGRGIENLWGVWRLTDDLDRRMGRTTYSRYNRITLEIAHRYGFCGNIGPAVFAAISPNNDERGCIKGTEDLMRVFRYSDNPVEAARRVRVTTYKPNKEKAIRIMNGEDPLKVLGGPKTRAFYLCTADPDNREHVVIDGHMYSAWCGKRMTLDEAKMPVGAYDRIAGDVRTLSRFTDMIPSQFQATLWFAWRRMHGLKAAGGALGQGLLFGMGME